MKPLQIIERSPDIHNDQFNTIPQRSEATWSKSVRWLKGTAMLRLTLFITIVLFQFGIMSGCRNLNRNSVSDVSSDDRTALSEGCVFDHVFLTVTSDQFRSIKGVFSDNEIQKKLGAKWVEEARYRKAFIMFNDSTVIEIWDESGYSNYGYQESCRVSNRKDIDVVSTQFAQQANTFGSGDGSFVTVGSQGGIGNPKGGVFFIHYQNRVVNTNGNGIRRIYRTVPEVNGGVPQDLLKDFQTGRLDISGSSASSTLVVKDRLGFERLVKTETSSSKLGLIAVDFTRTQSEPDNITFNNGGMAVKLTPQRGTIIFRADIASQFGITFDKASSKEFVAADLSQANTQQDTPLALASCIYKSNSMCYEYGKMNAIESQELRRSCNQYDGTFIPNKPCSKNNIYRSCEKKYTSQGTQHSFKMIFYDGVKFTDKQIAEYCK